MQKAQLLEVKEKGGTSMLTKVGRPELWYLTFVHVFIAFPFQINRDCPKYIIHTPPPATHAQAQDEAAAAGGIASSGSSIAVRCLFRPTSEHAQLLNVRAFACIIISSSSSSSINFPQVSKDSYLDSSEIIAKLSEAAAAVAAAGGPAFDGSNICLSAAMADVVFKKMPANARRNEGDVVSVEEVARACESKMAEFYELKTAAGCEIKRGSVKPIKVVVESLQGGRKHMTHVQNIDAWGIDPEAARTELQVIVAAFASFAAAAQPFDLFSTTRLIALFFTVAHSLRSRARNASFSECVPALAPCSRCLETTAKSCRYRALSTRRSVVCLLSLVGPLTKHCILQAIAYLTKTFGIDMKYIEKK
jgi:hypothetical protein